MYDLIIKNAAILDGTATPHYFSDVAVSGGKIALIAKNIKSPAAKIIDATGLFLSPGFIDAHSHFDCFMSMDASGWNNLTQGITTVVAGQCGQSPFPSGKGYESDLCRVMETVGGKDFDPSVEARGTFEAFLNTSNVPLGHHAAYNVGHGSLRASVMGYSSSKPTPEQMDEMCARLRECMKSGALGLTFGLIYPPSRYADTEEMVILSRVVAEYGGNVSAHIRNDGDALIESAEELIEVARRSGVRLILSHQKAIFKQNWGKIGKIIELVDKAASEGLDIFYDVYPYTASSTTLGRFIPQDMHALGLDKMLDMLKDPESRAKVKERVLQGRDPDEYLSDTMVGSSGAHPEYTGRFLPDIAKDLGTDACEVLFDILIEDRNTANGIYHRMCEPDVETALSHPRAMVGTDGLYSPKASGLHPRAFGTFTKFLGHYCRERKIVSLPEAIRKITAMPAAVHHLRNKGLIREGFDADLVLFDPYTIIDKSDYVNPTLVGEGIKYVFVLGEIAVQDGQITELRNGKNLRRDA